MTLDEPDESVYLTVRIILALDNLMSQGIVDGPSLRINRKALQDYADKCSAAGVREMEITDDVLAAHFGLLENFAATGVVE